MLTFPLKAPLRKVEITYAQRHSPPQRERYSPVVRIRDKLEQHQVMMSWGDSYIQKWTKVHQLKQASRFTNSTPICIPPGGSISVIAQESSHNPQIMAAEKDSSVSDVDSQELRLQLLPQLLDNGCSDLVGGRDAKDLLCIWFKADHSLQKVGQFTSWTFSQLL